MSNPLVSIIMGSQSDWDTMQAATSVLTELNVPFETKVVSAHRTPARLVEFAEGAAARGIQVIIAGAGGAAGHAGRRLVRRRRHALRSPLRATALHR